MRGRATLSGSKPVFSSEGMPTHEDEPVFREPWEAQAFALAVTLNENGVFTWSEWAKFLSSELRSADPLPDGSDYYFHWLTALQKLMVSKGVTNAPEVDELTTSWQRAALATPHGRPILLENDPQFKASI